MSGSVTTTVLFPASLDPGPLAALEGVELRTYDDPSAWPAGAAEAEVLVVGWGDPEDVLAHLTELTSLRLVQVLGAGVEHWTGRVPEGVWLSNARGAHGGPTAEWAVAALLAVVRELPAFVRAQDAGRWSPHATASLMGARVLVLGAGDLAVELARRLDGFDCAVTLVGRSARAGVESVDRLPELLGTSDALVVTVPLTPETECMVDAEVLASLPDGAIVVNAARGPVVDTDALLVELTTGRLRAALDVTDPEPLPPGHPLWTAPGLLLTPHVAGNTAGSEERGVAVLTEQIRQFVSGQVPDNLQPTWPAAHA